MTTLEGFVKTILEFFTSAAKNGQVTTGATFANLSATSVTCKLVYISNTTGVVLIVKQGDLDFYLPNGAVFPFNNVNDLSTLSVKCIDNSVATVTYRYEY